MVDITVGKSLVGFSSSLLHVRIHNRRLENKMHFLITCIKTSEKKFIRGLVMGGAVLPCRLSGNAETF